jgi:hypothetical protein
MRHARPVSGDDERADPEGGQGRTWVDWREGGFRGLPPWRRGFRPRYLAASLALAAGLLIVFLVAVSRLP